MRMIERARQNLYGARGVAWFIAMALWVAAVLFQYRYPSFISYRWFVVLAGVVMLVYILGKKPEKREQ